ncbi:hypothetical protein Airi01_035810 [Actinoallomurus iriomotensis]|uniref:Uncharacterized protein n=1 Tax=Actinoallomurus iriomotensis TaxID=478107 RepID=A0A9W6RGU0_9ACTN|nr:hypothetical protein Airi01_035810 [Actinoallomurus iriomotensis]
MPQPSTQTPSGINAINEHHDFAPPTLTFRRRSRCGQGRWSSVRVSLRLVAATSDRDGDGTWLAGLCEEGGR